MPIVRQHEGGSDYYSCSTSAGMQRTLDLLDHEIDRLDWKRKYGFVLDVEEGSLHADPTPAVQFRNAHRDFDAIFDLLVSCQQCGRNGRTLWGKIDVLPVDGEVPTADEIPCPLDGTPGQALIEQLVEIQGIKTANSG